MLAIVAGFALTIDKYIVICYYIIVLRSPQFEFGLEEIDMYYSLDFNGIPYLGKTPAEAAAKAAKANSDL